jgi:drug/metabolite transporter (DMT)-like permease
MTEYRKGLVNLLTAALLWSTGGLFIKLVPWPPLAVAGGRSAIAALVLLPLVWRRLKWEPVDLAAAVFYALTVTLFVTATKLTTAANAIFLQYTAPVYVAVMAHYYLKEKAGRADIFTILAVLGGMALFFYEKMSVQGYWGNVLAVISGVTFAAMTVLLRARKELPLRPIFYGNVLAALALSPVVMTAPPLAAPGIYYLLILGVFQLGLSYVFYARAVPHVGALQTVLVAMLEPLLNPLWVLLSIGERPSWMSVAGGAVIVTAVTLRSLKSV